jgi:hypothetical protein
VERVGFLEVNAEGNDLDLYAVPILLPARRSGGGEQKTEEGGG